MTLLVPLVLLLLVPLQVRLIVHLPETRIASEAVLLVGTLLQTEFYSNKCLISIRIPFNHLLVTLLVPLPVTPLIPLPQTDLKLI